MDGFLKIVGMATFVLALGAVVIMALGSNGAGMMMLFTALPIMVGGAATYALGAILTNLIAIRVASERQLDALADLAATQKRDTTSPHGR